MLLAGCASMSKSECLYADWQAVGFEDGASGAHASAVASRRQACARAGVTPDMAAYLAGRDQGLMEFCTPANGFRTGERGAAYSGVCARHNEASFLDEYRAGAHLYLLRDRVLAARHALHQATSDLGAIDAETVYASTALIRPDLTVAERAKLVVELTRLSEESDRIERALPPLQSTLDIAWAELNDYERELALRSYPARIAAR